MIYLFDIDGTLTPSRLRIDPEFEQFFLQWMKDKEVIFVTGSDKDKTIEQVGEKIWTSASRIYQSCGNAVYQGNKLGLEVHAGHGLTYTSAKILAKIKGIQEFNIGHFLVGESIFEGMPTIIKRFKKILKK